MTANYDRAVMESVKTLQLYELNQVPIDLEKIIANLKLTVKLCPYSRFSKQSGMDLNAIYDYFESEQGAVAYLRDREQYVIYYNDTLNNRGFERFTIAHELGHIFLKHHHDVKTDILRRGTISERKYQRFEHEANCFARNLLSPVPLVERITDIEHPRSAHDIMEAFDVSYTAAVVRRDFYEADSYRMNPDCYSYFSGYDILYGHYCLNCNNAEIGISGYCKICGEQATIFERSCNRIFYDGVELDKNNRAKKCPKCGNGLFSHGARFCRICGTSLYNRCLGEPVVDFFGNRAGHEYHTNDGNARFCGICGSRTTFFTEGFLVSWNGANNYPKPAPLYEAVAERNSSGYKLMGK